MRVVTTPLVSVLQGVNHVRRSLYRKGLLQSRRLPRPVVSIGNLSMGGSGKTPAAISISRMLQDIGMRPAILSRGYRRVSSRPWEVVRGDDVKRFGDEPVMMARALPGVPVIVGADRHAAGSAFLTTDECDLFLLDDGFQHIQLHRDCDIVIAGGGTAWSRERVSALTDADILLSRDGCEIPAVFGGPSFGVHLRPVSFRHRGEQQPVSTLENTPVVVFSGLANNVQFHQAVARHKASIIETISFRDHHVYTSDEISDLLSRAAGANATLVTTEKDWVKIRRDDIGVLEVEMVIDRPKALLNEIASRTGLEVAER